MQGRQQRHVGRERAVQALFSLELASSDELELGLHRFWSSMEEQTGDAARSFAEELIRGVLANREAIDGAIRAESENWRLERMARVDRNVLRVGVYELLYTSTPARVIINEAVEVARTFGGEGSPAFVNGILDRVARRHGKL